MSLGIRQTSLEERFFTHAAASPPGAGKPEAGDNRSLEFNEKKSPRSERRCLQGEGKLHDKYLQSSEFQGIKSQ